MASGVFDILHPGHLFYLTEARRLGDRLVVVVARDDTARRVKRQPIVPEQLRLEMVKGLKPVDDAILGTTGNMYETVERLRPDIIALGYDQRHDEEAIRAELVKRKLPAKVVRLPCLPHDLLATRRIIERVLALYNDHARRKDEGGRMKAEGEGRRVKG